MTQGKKFFTGGLLAATVVLAVSGCSQQQSDDAATDANASAPPARTVTRPGQEQPISKWPAPGQPGGPPAAGGVVAPQPVAPEAPAAD